MMDDVMIATSEEAQKYLSKIIGEPLRYALKSPDVDLYDFGLGDWIQTVDYKGRPHQVATYAIHAQCPLKVIWKNGMNRVELFDGTTDGNHFRKEIDALIGLRVKRVALSDKNDLWLDLGEFWVVFITWEESEESWRYFLARRNDPHLVASDTWLQFHNWSPGS